MEMCPEGGVRADKYLSSFNLCSLNVEGTTSKMK